jgi:putative DNA primase/helicase
VDFSPHERIGRTPILRVRVASQLEPRELAWFWTAWLGEGKLAMLDGDPGLGKSLVTLDLCARLSTGNLMPDGSPGPGTHNSLVLNAEDGAEDTINQRLSAMGADRDRVFVVDRPESDWADSVRLPSQCEALDQAVAQHQARLVVLDPIVAFLEPGILTSCDQSVRRALGPLHRIAALHRCSFLLVRHLNKEKSTRACYRGGGSIGFQGVCRSSWLLGRDPQEVGGLVLAQVKNNLAPLQSSLALRVAQPETAGVGEAGRTLIWGGPSSWSADQLLAGPPSRGPRAVETDRACRFLEKLLEDGPKSTTEIWEQAKAEGLSERTLRRAKELLRLRSQRAGNGHGHRAYWHFKHQSLPGDLGGDVDPEVDLSPWLDPLIAAYPPATPLDEDD